MVSPFNGQSVICSCVNILTTIDKIMNSRNLNFIKFTCTSKAHIICFITSSFTFLLFYCTCYFIERQYPTSNLIMVVVYIVDSFLSFCPYFDSVLFINFLKGGGDSLLSLMSYTLVVHHILSVHHSLLL